MNASRAIDDVWDLVANLYHSSTAGSDRLFAGETELLSADEARWICRTTSIRWSRAVR